MSNWFSAEDYEALQQRLEAVEAELEEYKYFVDCLNAGGIDDWDWLWDSLEPFREKYPDSDI